MRLLSNLWQRSGLDVAAFRAAASVALAVFGPGDPLGAATLTLTICGIGTGRKGRGSICRDRRMQLQRQVIERE
jgi:hypothetical protein